MVSNMLKHPMLKKDVTWPVLNPQLASMKAWRPHTHCWIMWMQIPKLYRKLKLEFNQGCHWGCVYIKYIYIYMYLEAS